jgi:LppP/LprE lipoprotein
MDAMIAMRSTARPLAVCAGCAALLGGCGGATKTVSVASSPPAQQETSTTASTASTATTHTPTTPASTTPTATTPAQPSTGGGTAAPGAARKAPEPAFAEHEAAGGEGASAAAAVVRAHGYTPNDTAEYHADQTLRVLVGTRTGSADGYGQQAFFFVDGRYIGTDTKEPSATVKVLAQSDTQVTLAYPLYRAGDPLSSPSAGQATVTFQLDNGQLTPVGEIPPARSTNGLSRY